MSELIKAVTQREYHKLQGQQVCYLFTTQQQAANCEMKFITAAKDAELGIH